MVGSMLMADMCPELDSLRIEGIFMDKNYENYLVEVTPKKPA